MSFLRQRIQKWSSIGFCSQGFIKGLIPVSSGSEVVH
ncbi:hypothetical protein NC652_016951 [Populus alba x Populus x berolinensis]|nr:hypothetical protein NC652_016951 [Populus alba x Populus x berolinensis]